MIRESVDLDRPSTTADAPEALGGGGHTVSFVAQRDGFLSVFYGTIQRAGSQYPTGEPTLEVYNNGVLVGTDDVLSHSWPAPVPIQRNCGGLYNEFNYNTTETVDLQIPVLTGETISFLFKSDIDTYGDDPDEGGTSPSGDQWAVAIGGFDPSCPFPIELFQFLAEVVECTGLNPPCNPSVQFVRQTDNMPVSGNDASLRVSTHQTHLDLPASSLFADTGPDADTYRLEALGLPAGETVTFEVKTTEAGGSPVNVYTYDAVEGTDPTSGDPVYRTEQFFRLVSNGIPTVGPDPSADYDDEYSDSGANEDPTLLVKLGATVRGAVSDPSGEVASVTLPLGIQGMPPNPPVEDTILTGSLVFNEIRDLTNSPTINATLATERASEDWAQGRIQFEVGGTASDIYPVKNIVRLSGTATGAGQVKVTGTADCCFAPVNFAVVVNVNVGDTAEIIASNVASAIMNNNSDIEANAHVHSPVAGVDDALVHLDAVPTAWPDGMIWNSLKTDAAGVLIDEPVLEFEPLTITDADFFEQHSIALNYADDDLTTIDVFAVPSGTFDAGFRAYSWAYVWHVFIEGIENSTFVDEEALDDPDTGFPFTFGHELGHILFNAEWAGSTPSGHHPDDHNLMKDGTDTTETWDASKRLDAVQITDARTDSGPGATNPVILKDN